MVSPAAAAIARRDPLRGVAARRIDICWIRGVEAVID